MLAFAAVLVVAGGTCVTVGLRADPRPAGAATPDARPAPALATPLWSPRRVPAVFARAEAAATLTRSLSAALAPFAGCVIVDDAHGPVVQIAPDRPLAGASTQKLLVAAAALEVLGPQYRFETRAVTDGSLRDGDLSGNLTIVGAGDPVLSASDAPSTNAAPSTPLSELADAIVRAGVRRIEGALLADDSRYDRERAVPDWKPNEITEGDVGALGALIVNGGRAANGLAAPDPALGAVEDLATMLSARGVQIGQGTNDPGRAAPAAAHEIARVASPPLAQIVEQMLTVSNDETAEMLTRELGAVRAHAGTTTAGTQAVPAVLARLGVPVAGVRLHDGSGLAPDDQVTCAALAGVVALGTQPRFSPVMDGLAIAGETGTLAGQLVGSSLAGRVRAKTGHIDGVVGLAGVVTGPGAAARPTRPGPVEARFAFVANGDFSTDAGMSMQDQVAEAVGTFVDAPAAPDPVPTPR